ncbi:uncharacterized protein [Palaemon carinicauda]|uniref:uncharacterized protein n=1 Tax=Palaemon carinicauda TaxID=392227 RepID=UPI0035B61D35
MAKSVLVCMLVFTGLVTTSWALQCLKCNDCENEPSRSSSCLPGFNTCAKTNLGGKIRKFCAPEIVCSVENIDRDSINPLKNLRTIFSDDDIVEISVKEGRGKEKAIHCCDSDFCNGSTEKKTTLGLLLASSLVVYLLAR